MVLSRFKDEIIDITTASGDKIEVTIVDVRGDKVRVGVAADKAVTIHRREISQRIEREKESACSKD